MSIKRWTDFQQFLEQFEPDSIYPGEISEPNIFDKHGYGGESRPSSPVSVKSKPGFGEWKPPAGEDKPKGFSEPFSNPEKPVFDINKYREVATNFGNQGSNTKPSDISPAPGDFDELLSKLDDIKRNNSVSVKSKPGFGEWKPPAGEDKPKGFSEPFSNPDISPALGYFDELLSKLDDIKRNNSVSQVGPQPESPVAPSPILRRPDSNEPGVSANRDYSGFDVEQYNKLQDVIAESGRGKDLGWFTNTQPFNPALISGMATEIKDSTHKKIFETLGYKNYNNPVTVSGVGITAAEIPELSNFENLLTRLEEEKQRAMNEYQKQLAMNEHQKQLAGGGHQRPGPRPERPGPRPERPGPRPERPGPRPERPGPRPERPPKTPV